MKQCLYNSVGLDTLSVTAERTLKLIAKYLQNLANQVEFRTKVGYYGLFFQLLGVMKMVTQEQYMIVLNDHLKDNMEKMKKFIDNLSVNIFSLLKSKFIITFRVSQLGPTLLPT